MSKIRLSAKGQLVLPAELRKRMRLKPGTEFAVDEQAGRIILQPVTDQYIQSLRGMLGDTTDLIEQLRRDHEKEDWKLETLRIGRKRVADLVRGPARRKARRRARQRGAA